jgi:hypothetical protein
MWRYIWRNRLDTLVRGLFIAAFIIIAADFKNLRATAAGHLEMFRQTGSDYEGLRRANAQMKACLEADARMPEDVLYAYNQPYARSRIYLLYALCPNKNSSVHWGPDSPKWQYYIDFAGEIRNPPEAWKSVQLTDKARLFARPGNEILQPDRTPPPPMAWRVFIFAALALCELLGGLALLSLLRVPADRGGILWYLGASYLAGFIMTTGLVWIGLMAGLKLSIPFTAAAAAAPVLVFGAAGYRQAPRTLRSLFSAASFKSAFPLSLPGALLMAAVIYYMTLYLIPAVYSPVMSWDALSHWMYKAKALFHLSDITFSEAAHINEYPILWPLNIAAQYVAAGGVYDEMAMWTVALLLVVFFTQLAGIAAHARVNPLLTWTALPVFTFCFTEPALRWAYAETAFLAFLAAALAMITAFFNDDRKPGWLAAALLFACGVAAAKFEGGPAAIILAIAIALSWPRFPRNWRAWAAGAVFCLPILITIGWYAWQTRQGYVGTAHMEEGMSWAKLQLLYEKIMTPASYWKDGPGWLLFMGMGFAVVMRFQDRWQRHERFLALAGLGLLMFSVIAFSLWPERMLQNAVYTALPRLMLHAAPALFMLVILRIGRTTTGTEDNTGNQNEENTIHPAAGPDAPAPAGSEE